MKWLTTWEKTYKMRLDENEPWGSVQQECSTYLTDTIAQAYVKANVHHPKIISAGHMVCAVKVDDTEAAELSELLPA